MAQITSDQLATLMSKVAQVKGFHTVPAILNGTDKYGNTIQYNKEQQEFINLALQGKSCILLGPAGTGKTTTMNGLIHALIQSGKVPIFANNEHKYLPASGTPGIIACSYTRRAVSNLRKSMPPDLTQNCITIHKTLEYEPVYTTVLDPESGEEKTKMSFSPTRDCYNPLSSQIYTVIIDEASMVSVDLFNQLIEALPHNPQFIFVGDIYQLPPIFGAAILGFKMLELPTVELTQVYRQALESPIISYATKIRTGETFTVPENKTIETPKGTLTLHPWKKKLNSDVACLTFCKFITQALEHGKYDPNEDMILIPFNKAFGTEEVNKYIANHIAKQNNRTVYEVISGFNKLYFSVGDHILYDKEDATIVAIEKNRTYLGKSPQPASVTLDYWGYNSSVSQASESTDDIDAMLESLSDLSEDRVNSASHIITVRLDDSGREVKVSATGDLNSIILGYALTVHKAQGSEWQKVFLVIHQSHATMCQRELLYTGFTRAAKELYVICEPETFVNGVKSQRIKGDTLAEKAEYFKGALEKRGGSLIK